MKFAWMFGSSMEAHHLLYSYLSVLLIQGGYCAWIAWQWVSAKPDSRARLPPSSASRDGYYEKIDEAE